MSTHDIQVHDKIRKVPKIFVFLTEESSKRVRINLGKRAIGVRAIEVRLYIRTDFLFGFTCMIFSSVTI